MNNLCTFDGDDVVVAIEGQLLLLEGSLGGVARIEDLIKFFESTVLGFWNEEVDNDGLDSAPDGEDDIGPPFDGLE